jgi:transposase-like protein
MVCELIDADTGQPLAIIRHRDAKALEGFLKAQGYRWCREVRVVVSDGSGAYRSAIAAISRPSQSRRPSKRRPDSLERFDQVR